jgi:hypothetical protein
MEPFACKTLILHLAWDHELYIDTFTTDRSTSVKAMIRFVRICFSISPFLLSSDLADALPPNHPLIVHFYDIWHFIKVGENNF